MVYLLDRSDFELGRDFCAAQVVIVSWLPLDNLVVHRRMLISIV